MRHLRDVCPILFLTLVSSARWTIASPLTSSSTIDSSTLLSPPTNTTTTLSIPITPDDDFNSTDPDGSPYPSPRHKDNLFDDLVTAGLALIAAKYPLAKPYNIVGHIQSEHIAASTDCSVFRALHIETWSESQRLEIITSNKKIDARLWNGLIVHDPGAGSKKIGIRTFDWANEKRMGLKKAFDRLRELGKLQDVEWVSLNSQTSPKKGTAAVSDRQPYYIFHFENPAAGTLWLGAWDGIVYPGPLDDNEDDLQQQDYSGGVELVEGQEAGNSSSPSSSSPPPSSSISASALAVNGTAATQATQ